MFVKSKLAKSHQESNLVYPPCVQLSAHMIIADALETRFQIELHRDKSVAQRT